MGAIVLRGSKERLQRIVSRSGGRWLPERRFDITMEAYCRRGSNLSFVFHCAWESREDGIHICYRPVPTLFTVLIPLAAILFFAVIGIIAVSHGGVSDWPVFLLPALGVFGWLRALQECIRDFRKLFAKPTC